MKFYGLILIFNEYGEAHWADSSRCDYEREYVALHIPSGKQFTNKKVFVSQTAFLKCLAIWNRLGGNQWKYWEA